MTAPDTPETDELGGLVVLDEPKLRDLAALTAAAIAACEAGDEALTVAMPYRIGDAGAATGDVGSSPAIPVNSAAGGETARTITLPWPDRDLSPNARVHHMARARATNAARTAAFWHAKGAGIGAVPEGRIAVAVTFHPPSRRGDRHNMPAMVKAHIDGIADAMGVDDRVFDVTFAFGEVRKGGAVVVTVAAQA